MPKDKLFLVSKYKIHQALINILDRDHSEPEDILANSRHKVNVITTPLKEQDEIDFLLYQILDPTYQYDLSPLFQQRELSVI